jgi:Protein of unknown function (DUF1573)
MRNAVGCCIGLVLSFALAACRITDHTEADEGEITTDIVNVPASGYSRAGADERPNMRFDADSYDAGRVSQGTQVEHTFTFTNDGDAPLLITDVRGSCGCTVPRTWPRHPVPEGKKGSITVTFDTKGRSGLQDKTISIVANTVPPTTVVHLRAEVMAPSTNSSSQ